MGLADLGNNFDFEVDNLNASGDANTPPKGEEVSETFGEDNSHANDVAPAGTEVEETFESDGVEVTNTSSDNEEGTPILDEQAVAAKLAEEQEIAAQNAAKNENKLGKATLDSLFTDNADYADKGFLLHFRALARDYGIPTNQPISSIVSALANAGVPNIETGVKAAYHKDPDPKKIPDPRNMDITSVEFFTNQRSGFVPTGTAIGYMSVDFMREFVRARLIKHGSQADVEAILSKAGFKVGASLSTYKEVETQLQAALQVKQESQPKAEQGTEDDRIVELCKNAWNNYADITEILNERAWKPLCTLYTKILQSVDRAYGVLGLADSKEARLNLGVNTLTMAPKKDERGATYYTLEVARNSYGKPNCTQGDKTVLVELLAGVHKALGLGKEAYNTSLTFNPKCNIRSTWHLYHIMGYFPTYCAAGMVHNCRPLSEADSKYRHIPNPADKDEVDKWQGYLRNDIYSEFFTYMCQTALEDSNFKGMLEKIYSGELVIELKSKITSLVTDYTCKTASVFFVRSVPSLSGVFWLQYMYFSVARDKQGTESISNNVAISLKNTFQLLEDGANSNAVHTTAARGAKLLHNGIEADEELSKYGVYTSLLVNNSELYIQKPLFSYKPIQSYIANKVPLDAYNILLGRTLTNADYKISLNDFEIMTIYATSRAGKGVMTLSVLAYLMASGIPIAYADAKPDMAGVMWNLQESIGASRGLTLEFYRDVNVSNQKDKKDWYVLAKRAPKGSTSGRPLPGNMAKYATWQPKLNPSVTALGEAFGIDPSLFKAGEPGSPLGYLAYTKFIAMLIGLRKAFTKPIAVVVDEIDNYMASGLGEKFVSGVLFDLAKKYSETASAIKNIQSKIATCKKPEDLAKLNDRLGELMSKETKMRPLVRNFITDSTTVNENTTNAGIAPVIVKNLQALSNQLESGINLKLIVIGQNYDTVRGWTKDANNLEAINTLVKQSIIRTYVTVKQGSAITIQGNFKENCGCKEHYENKVLGTIQDKTEYDRAVHNAYLHEDKVGVSGFWAVTKPNDTKVTITKSYMVLNENDIYMPDPTNEELSSYVAPMLNRLPNNIVQDVIQDDLLDESGNARASTGFLGMMNLIGNTENIKTSIESGYDIIWEAFRQTNLCKKLGYTCLEEYIYDFRPESFDIDFSTVGADAGEPTDYGAPADESGSTRFYADEQGAPVAPPADYTEDTVVQGQGNPTPAEDNTSVDVVSPAHPKPDEQPKQPNLETFNVNNPLVNPKTGTTVPVQGQGDNQGAQGNNQGAQGGAQGAQGGNPSKVDTIYGEVDANQNTQYLSAFNADDAYQRTMDLGGEADNPFVVYRKNFKLLRREITKHLEKHLRIMVSGSAKGSLDSITSFTEENGRIIINNMPFTPTIDWAILAVVPLILRKQIMSGCWACVLDFSLLKSMHNLSTINIKDRTLVDNNFWEDTRIKPYDTDKLKKKFKKLRVFNINGTDILKEADSEGTTKDSDTNSGLEKGTWASRASTIANAIGVALGVPGCSGDKHPVLSSIGQSTGMKAVKKGAMFGTSCWIGSMLLGLANPFIILGGLFTVGSYIKGMKEGKSK